LVQRDSAAGPRRDPLGRHTEVEQQLANCLGQRGRRDARGEPVERQEKPAIHEPAPQQVRGLQSQRRLADPRHAGQPDRAGPVVDLCQGLDPAQLLGAAGEPSRPGRQRAVRLAVLRQPGQATQLGRGLHAELVERVTGLVVDPHRLDPVAVLDQRAHQQDRQALPARVGVHVRPQPVAHPPVVAGGQLQLGEVAVRVDQRLIQGDQLAATDPVDVEVFEEPAAPQVNGLVQQAGRPGERSVPSGFGRLIAQLGEPMRVQLRRIDTQHVTGRRGPDQLALVARVPERLAQLGDVTGNQVRLRLVRAPHDLDQAPGRDRFVGMEQKHNQDVALLKVTEIHRDLAVPRLERAQHPKLHTVSHGRAFFPVNRIVAAVRLVSSGESLFRPGFVKRPRPGSPHVFRARITVLCGV
jgi:hypothetical protein